MVQRNQFFGSPMDDPNSHLSIFVKFYDTLKMSGVDQVASWLRIFPFFLGDMAIEWLQALPSNSITTWNELKVTFLAWYSLPSKMTQLRNHITFFKKSDSESLFKSWEQFKEIMRLCPFHGLEKWLIVLTFYNGLIYSSRMTLGTDAGGYWHIKIMTRRMPLSRTWCRNTTSREANELL